METLTLRTPDDFHIHLRDGDALTTTVRDAAFSARRGLIMPNLVPPVVDANSALQYRDRILAHVPKGMAYEPLMSLYLTDKTTPAMIAAAAQTDAVKAVKLYPAGATTNSDKGITELSHLDPVFAELANVGLPLLIHGEVTSPTIDIFDREQLFIETELVRIMAHHPNLRIVLEHITTEFAATFIANSTHPIAATITAHHLLINRNDLLVGGIKPHNYCLPIVKRHSSQLALLKAATSGNPKFFLGSDSAPHAKQDKESACGCAGVYTANALLPYYAMAFEQMGALSKLEDFASRFGADFYGLPYNEGTVTLIKEPATIPNSVPLGSSKAVVPLFAGKTIPWQLA